jgi:hypothetical protein
LAPPPGKSALDLLSTFDFEWARRVRGARVLDDVTLWQEAQFTRTDEPRSDQIRQTAGATWETGRDAQKRYERLTEVDKALGDLEHIALRLSRSLYGV